MFPTSGPATSPMLKQWGGQSTPAGSMYGFGLSKRRNGSLLRNALVLVSVLQILAGAFMMTRLLLGLGGPQSTAGAMMLAALNIGLGAAGLLGRVCDAVSIKTFYVVCVAFLVVQTLSFLRQVTLDTENDCILAETMVRLDHLEGAATGLRHDELVDAVLVRLKQLHDDFEDVEVSGADIAAARAAQAALKDADAELVNERLARLVELSERSFAKIDAGVAEVSAKVADAAAAVAAGNGAADGESREQQLRRTKLRSLERRREGLQRKLDAVNELRGKLTQHTAAGVVPPSVYKSILASLKRYTTDAQIAREMGDDFKTAHEMAAAADRMQLDQYDELDLTGVRPRQQARSEARQRKRAQFEEYVTQMMDMHDNKLADPPRFMKSLQEHLDDLPELCLRRIATDVVPRVWGWVVIGVAVAGAYAALTGAIVEKVSVD